MLKMSGLKWRALRVPPAELRLDITLVNGQSFTWKETAKDEWMNVLQGYVVGLRQTADDVLFQVYNAANEDAWNAAEISLRNYFQLDVCMVDLYSHWSAADEQFAPIGKLLPGIRILRQDPTENLFSFICSSNNNIVRISSMVNTLREKYGQPVANVDGFQWRAFPAASALARDGIDEELRAHGFGYRAKFIHQTAKKLVQDHGNQAADWLISLRGAPYQEARARLLELQGVGPKVADCVCLFSLDKIEAVPVDTHVWQIAQPYMPHLQSKTLTARIYQEIGDFYRKLHGQYAGWAHSILFSADLKRFEARVGPSPRKKKPTKAKGQQCVEAGKGKGAVKIQKGSSLKADSKAAAMIKDEPSLSSKAAARKNQKPTKEKQRLSSGTKRKSNTATTVVDVSAALVKDEPMPPATNRKRKHVHAAHFQVETGIVTRTRRRRMETTERLPKA